MSSKRHIRRKSCEGKIGYTSQNAAYKAMVSLKRSDDQHGRSSQMSFYHCKFCGQWHVGHSRPYNPYLPKKDRFKKF